MEPNGKPGNFRECVDRLPISPIAASVRARSASEGSGTFGVAGPGPGVLTIGHESNIADSRAYARLNRPYRLTAGGDCPPAKGQGTIASWSRMF